MRASFYTLLFFLIGSFFIESAAQPGSERMMEKGWRFTREDPVQAMEPGFSDDSWQAVTVPHDWAIYGPFDAHNDLQKMAITQDGQQEALAHAGRTGGLPFIGVGWYRLRFTVPEFSPGMRASLLFDGAMSNARVYVNGREAGFWPYGYNSFHFDVTDLLLPGEENLLAVRLENFPESSRWYPGAGLYRNVHLRVTSGLHIPVWGTQVTTPVVREDFARVVVRTTVEKPAGMESSSVALVTEIRDAQGRRVASAKSGLTRFDEGVIEQHMVVEQPALWDTDHPHLYTAVSRLYAGEALSHEYTTRFGIRTLEVIPGKGFFLNGRRTQFKGVCNHHDLGPLGAAVNEAAIRRQVRMMKEMGVNAIRTSHNMPAPELVRACDEMGMMVMAETFDEWKSPKMRNGYHIYFDEWAEKDLTNLVRHYRNNPSVVMWCIGNEVPDQGSVNGPKIARFLQDICHREDPTRPVTQGMDHVDVVAANNFAAVMDVAGFNYRSHRYRDAFKRLPQEIVLGAETASTVSSRGVYKLPAVRRSMAKYEDHQSSSYDLEHCDWSDLPEDNFIQHDDLEYCIGEFVWTGFDYLGEPTPYYTDWPSHSSLFGIVDLAGIPKDRYYLYRSHWNDKVSTLHILPHWNWQGHEGEVVPVMVYTSYPSAELFINGKSQGRRTKDRSVTLEGSDNKASQEAFDRQKRYRLMWMETRYEPGTVRVVAYDAQGKEAEVKEMHTAGKPHHIALSADRSVLGADGRDIAFINVRVVDKEGNLCPHDSREISFTVEGAGQYKAAANGNSICLTPFQSPVMPLFSGQLSALVQASENPGEILFEASAKGVKKARLVLTTTP
ncbi:MAG TPA: glycoside hydrolase family 2 TIM barrel-domain containing protein [Prolixibacteraceae bacterium]|nr:glycoside hydrolase family 2 TIM barrel-domain containing protein [Prolixibacteraceae bacterium]